jgi:hypothetical protein
MSIQDTYGYVISKNDTYIVREKIDKDGKVVIYVHHVKDGKELVPSGYVLGDNALYFNLNESINTA